MQKNVSGTISATAQPKDCFDPITAQPTDTSCGPTCLHAVYRYYRQNQDLIAMIGEIPQLENGGTLGVHLGLHALDRGFRVRLYTYNLNVFDPTWFPLKKRALLKKLKAASDYHQNDRQLNAIQSYRRFIKRGGQIRFKDLNGGLIRKYLNRGLPIITGLSATCLYRESREIPESCQSDDIRGEPSGHFVVLTGYDRARKMIDVADPYANNPAYASNHYEVGMDRLINAILLGVITYDANLLIIQPKD